MGLWTKQCIVKIIEDWQSAFPQLSVYKGSRLYKVLGPMVIGLEVNKMPYDELYRPYLVAYPLWKKDLDSCFDHPFILQQFYNKDKLICTIPCNSVNKDMFINAVDNIRHRSLISFDGDILLSDMMQNMVKYARASAIFSNQSSCMYALYLEAKMKVALYIDTSQALGVMEEITHIKWNESSFEAFEINLGGWLRKLQQEIFERENFLKRIETNRSNAQVARLNSSELLPG